MDEGEELVNARCSLLAIGMAFLGGAALAARPAAAWKGEEVVRDGVRHVVNPETPVEEVTLLAKEQWQRGGEDDDILFGMVSQLVRDGQGNIYLLDGQLSEIHVFSPTGEHLRKIGREGEGPGEFRNATDMYLGPNGTLGVVQVFPGRIVQLATNGTPAGNFPLPEVEGGGFQLVFVGRGLADRVVLAGAQQQMQGGQQVQSSYLEAFDPNGKSMVRYHEEKAETRFGGMKFIEKTFSNFQRRWALAPDGRVAAALAFDDYKITVWKADGSVDQVIERPQYAPLERTSAAKQRYQKFYDAITRWNPGSTFEVSATHPAVAQIFFRDDGSLWILPARGMWERKPGVFASFDVYDKQGRFMRRAHLVLDGDPVEDGIFFVGDRVYQVTDLFGAVMANFGGGTAAADGEAVQAEPVKVIAYEVASKK